VADTSLNYWAPDQNLGDSPLLFVRQGDILASLLRFDTSAIPHGSIVEQAILNLYIDHRTNTGHLTASVYDVNRGWNESEATWHRARDGEDWDVAGCNGDLDRGATPVVTLDLDADDTWFSIDLTPLVQAWVDDPGTNHGLIIKGAGTVSVQYESASMEATNDLKWPRLYVQYVDELATPTSTLTLAPTPTPTHTPTASPTPTSTSGPSPTPTATFVPPPALASGAEVFAVSADTYIYRWSIDENFGAADRLVVRQGDVAASLLSIPLAGLPTDEVIESARLYLYVIDRSNAGYLFTTVHKVLRSWDEYESNWIVATEGSEWYESGCNKIGLDRAGESVDEVALTAQGAWYAFDITERKNGSLIPQPITGLSSREAAAFRCSIALPRGNIPWNRRILG